MEKACQAKCYPDKNELNVQLNVVDLGVGQAYHAARLKGALAQLGERHNGIVEVSGSIPLGSTKNLLPLRPKYPANRYLLIWSLDRQRRNQREIQVLGAQIWSAKGYR